jgi:hypothetical protein
MYGKNRADKGNILSEETEKKMLQTVKDKNNWIKETVFINNGEKKNG